MQHIFNLLSIFSALVSHKLVTGDAVMKILIDGDSFRNKWLLTSNTQQITAVQCVLGVC